MSGSSGQRVVVGGSVAALVAADQLAAAGVPVRLLLPERGVGGGFAPLRHEGRTLELGVRLLELDYGDDPGAAIPPLADYRPGAAGHRPYQPLVRSFIEELAGEGLREVARPRMAIGGRICDDLHFTTDATVLRDALDPDERAQVAFELRQARDVAADPAGLLAPARAGELRTRSLDAASREQHGALFHRRLVAPIADKLMAGGAARVIASLRRKAWLPLFWPATLLQACGDGPVDFVPRRPFHTISPEGPGRLPAALLERVRARPSATVETAGALTDLRSDGADGVVLGFASHAPVSARRPVLGCSPKELHAAAGIDLAAETARTVIAWVEADPADLAEVPSLLTAADPDVPLLRVSTGGAGAPAGRVGLTCELPFDTDGDLIGDVAREGLERCGLLREGAGLDVVKTAAAPTFPLPTRENVLAFASAAEQLAAQELDLALLGASAAFGADALNEQIVQGLAVAETMA